MTAIWKHTQWRLILLDNNAITFIIYTIEHSFTHSSRNTSRIKDNYERIFKEFCVGHTEYCVMIDVPDNQPV